ncbi:GDSL-type esterase/lipase family protein [Flavihumibacter sp. CACIAM 22H1]|uniref:GDSL-type esterase/lipase family protein n=1 Tax=Flavihumibacter sp. CACIAM 22H1 TaxID=1812911 RepID=UPI000A7A150A|nr:GDSL-type esterase/lipase family protein [Flavihumibacter sp. CACIAM 22H1]
MKQIFLGWLLSVLLFSTSLTAQDFRIACVGNSITYGSGVANREKNSYPAQLQAMLGKGYLVQNFGLGGTTLLKKGNKPYWTSDEFRRSLESRPDLVFIKLGTNDSKAVNRPFHANLVADLTELVKTYQQLPTHPRVILLLPVPSFYADSNSIYDPVIRSSIIPAVQQVAYETGVELIDLYQLFINREDLLPDKIHPNSLGATVMAKRLYEAIQQETTTAPDFRKILNGKQVISSFYGYRQSSLQWQGRTIYIVEPKRTAKGRPWIWRARFWGHEPQLDIALLERGFHLVYCDVAELFGNKTAIAAWNQFYGALRTAGLAAKMTLEGMSRGGVYVYNWALANPDKVACIYADAPVLDLKSWPGGLGKGPGSAADWELFKKAYGLTETAARNFKASPLDKAEQIARLKIPLVHVVGDADEVVPLAENTALFEERVLAAGGHIAVIHKPGIKHHPHSLPNPSPILDFILRANGYKLNFATLPAPGSEFRSGAGWFEGKDWWQQNQDIDSLLLAEKNLDIVFLGNSITQGIGGKRPNVSYKPGLMAFDAVFGSYRWISAGISGDRTQTVLWRLQNGNYKLAAPRLIVLTIGVNNMGDDSGEEIFEGVLACVNWIKTNLPATKLIVTGPLPAGMEKKELRRQQYETIHLLLENHKMPGVIYFPLHKTFIGEDGRLNPDYYSRDGIHLVEEGYKIWAIELGKIIKTTLAK